MIRIFTLLFKALLAIWPMAENWATDCGVQREPYHGGVFNGNACRKLLGKVSYLEETCPHKEYINTFKAFTEVVDACFGKELAADYKDKINYFHMCFASLEGVNITPKLHALIFHVPQFCDYHGLGLGHFSEQASEAVHKDFNMLWKRYSVSPVNSKYGERLLAATREYASRHV